MSLWAGIVISLAAIGVPGLAQSVPDSQAQPASSLAHLRAGEALLKQRNFQSAANEFNQALKADHQPAWTDVWAHIDLGRTLDATGQRDRAVREYQLALETGDNTFGALEFANVYLRKAPTLDEVSPLPPEQASVTSPTVLSRVEPEYSPEAGLARLEGTVLIAVSVDRDGTIVDLQVLKPLGLGLDEAALDAVRRWKFSPGTVRGQASLLVAPVEIHFQLPSRAPGWHVRKIHFEQREGVSRPVLLHTGAFTPGKMAPELVEEATIDTAISRIPDATISMEIDSAGNPSKFVVQSASLPIWGEDAVRAIGEWRFRPGNQGDTAMNVPCTMELAWFAP